MNNDIITNRHDFLLLFEVTNGNPNGDPDMGNMPRLDPNTNRGLITDVCQKRKIRNFVEEFAPDRPGTSDDEKAASNGFNILIKQGTVIETEQKRAIAATSTAKKPHDAGFIPGDTHAERAKNWLCREYYDVRTFGGVLSTGDDVMKGSSFGQVRGPVQFTFAQSFHAITPLEISITRCAVTKEEDAKKERTMGNKHIVPYALYVAKGYVSPAFAEKTGFTNADLELLFDAISHMFTDDASAARSEMVIRGIYDFEHVGTQHENNAAQNRRESRLGCAHAHKLFEGITVSLSDEALAAGKEFPESFKDYNVTNVWTGENLPLGVKLTLRHDEGSEPLGPRTA
ncbi:MAG: type I-C CRISPR-associated protein Cas7/Csd2 [Akkermansiaceae bacterium]